MFRNCILYIDFNGNLCNKCIHKKAIVQNLQFDVNAQCVIKNILGFIFVYNTSSYTQFFVIYNMKHVTTYSVTLKQQNAISFEHFPFISLIGTLFI